MKLKDLVAHEESLIWQADPETEITSLCYDSRKVVPGCLFVAIRGLRTDGNRFISAAKEKGAAAVIVDHDPIDVCIPYVLVRDSRRALAVASASFFGHPEREVTMIGVTGTNGKTTVTTLICSMLEDMGVSCGLIGTNGNVVCREILETERTTPESLELFALFRLMVDRGCRVIVMEVSSHSLELDRVYGIHFDTAVFTNLTQDHLDFHHTMQAYAAAKSKLFGRCDHAVINADDQYAQLMIQSAHERPLLFSAQCPDADLYASDISLEKDHVEFIIHSADEKDVSVSLAIPGMFSVYNAMSAMGCLKSLGVPLFRSASSLAKARGVKGRAQVVPTETDFTVMLDYAHTPDGVENILDTARGFAHGRVLSLFGCGGDRDKTKRPIMGEVAGRLSDLCVVTSDNPRSEDPMAIIDQIIPGVERSGCPYRVIENRREAIRYILSLGRKGDVIVLMGKGHENYQEINGRRSHFDEYEEVMKYFKNLNDQ